METKPIQEMSEVELYFVIDGCGAFIWRMNHDMAHGRIEQEHHAAIDEDITRMRATQKEAILELPRVGIAQPLNEQGAGTPEYWTWYQTWSAWHKDKLSDGEWNDLNARISRGLTEE